MAPYFTVMKGHAPQRTRGLHGVFHALRWLACASAPWPLVRSVPTDLALDSDAALVRALRLAQAGEHAQGAQNNGLDAGPVQRAWKRAMTPAAKLWTCKRAVQLTGEAMEVPVQVFPG